MKKIVKEEDAVATIEYKDNVDVNTKNILDNFINNYYEEDDCDYILKVKNNEFKGDLMCLCSMGNGLVRELSKNSLISSIKIFTVIDKIHNIYANILQDYE